MSNLISSLFVALILTALIVPHSSLAQSDELPRWMEFDQALESAQYSQKPIVVDVYAEWCGWCERLEQNVHADDEVRSFLESNFELARLDLGNESSMFQYEGRELTTQQLASFFRAHGTPTTIFLQPDGTYITRLPGYVDAPVYKQVLQFIESGAYRTQDFADFQAQNP